MGLATKTTSTSGARRFWALLLCVLWIAGFEIGPGVHVAFHDAFGHHHHGAAAAHEQASADDHHAHAPHHEDHAHAHEVEHHRDVHGHGHAHDHADEHHDDLTAHEDYALADEALLSDGSDDVFAADDAFEDWDDEALFDEDVHEHDHEAAHASHDEDAPAESFDVQPASRDLLASAVHESLACPAQIGHGAHALAHRGVVAFPSVSPWPPVAVAPWAPVLHGQAYPKSVEDRTPRSVRARGPPVVA